MAFECSLEFILSGKPERVMQLLTDPALIRRWSGEDAVLEHKVGGRFELFDGWVKGEVLKIGGNELAYTWKPGDWAENIKASEVHYLLKEDEAGTKVIVTHSSLPSEKERDKYKTEWTDFVFDPLEDYIMVTEKD